MNYLFLSSISINFGLVSINHPQSPYTDLSYGWRSVRLAILIDMVRVFDYKSILFVIFDNFNQCLGIEIILGNIISCQSGTLSSMLILNQNINIDE